MLVRTHQKTMLIFPFSDIHSRDNSILQRKYLVGDKEFIDSKCVTPYQALGDHNRALWRAMSIIRSRQETANWRVKSGMLWATFAITGQNTICSFVSFLLLHRLKLKMGVLSSRSKVTATQLVCIRHGDNFVVWAVKLSRLHSCCGWHVLCAASCIICAGF